MLQKKVIKKVEEGKKGLCSSVHEMKKKYKNQAKIINDLKPVRQFLLLAAGFYYTLSMLDPMVIGHDMLGETGNVRVCNISS